MYYGFHKKITIIKVLVFIGVHSCVLELTITVWYTYLYNYIPRYQYQKKWKIYRISSNVVGISIKNDYKKPQGNKFNFNIHTNKSKTKVKSLKWDMYQFVYYNVIYLYNYIPRYQYLKSDNFLYVPTYILIMIISDITYNCRDCISFEVYIGFTTPGNAKRSQTRFREIDT